MTSSSSRNFWISLGMAAGAALAARQVVRMRKMAGWQSSLQQGQVGTALVTGASSGIGEEYARQLARLGFDLVLVARRRERLEALAGELRQANGVSVEVLRADLSNLREIGNVEKRIKQGGITFLVNNAGFGVPGNFVDLPADTMIDQVRVHIIATVRLTKAALPSMLERGSGVIVNVSSVASFFALPGDSIYGPTKTFLNQFTESLALSMRPKGIRLQVLSPGFTSTPFHFTEYYEGIDTHARIPAFIWLQPDKVVSSSLNSVAAGDIYCIPGWQWKAVSLLGRTGIGTLAVRMIASLNPEILKRMRGYSKNMQASGQTNDQEAAQ